MEKYEQQAVFLGDKASLLGSNTVAIVGLGALGSVAAELLVRAGIGKVVLIDHDLVELGNLQRQSLYSEADVGKLKAEVAASVLSQINSEVVIVSHAEHLNNNNVKLLDADVVLDCTDNLESRFVINAHCKREDIQWVHAAAAGAVGVVLPVVGDYCFNCVYLGKKGALDCSTAGILNTASFMTASLQVTAALKILVGSAVSGLIRFNVWDNKFDVYSVKKNADCVVCQGDYSVLQSNGNGFAFKVAKCKTRAAYSVKPNKQIKLDLGKIKKNFKTVLDTPIVVVIESDGVEIIVHNYGELVFKKFDDEKKIKEIAEKVYRVGM
jgi:molybdopterin-synthase adenylyltransferase